MYFNHFWSSKTFIQSSCAINSRQEVCPSMHFGLPNFVNVCRLSPPEPRRATCQTAGKDVCRWPTVPIWPPFLFYFSFITHPSQVNKSKKELWSAYSSSPGKQLCGFGCRKTPTALSFPFPSLPGSWGRSCLQPKDLRVVLLPTANPLTSDWKMSLWNMVICSHLKKFHPSIEKAIGAIPLVWPQRHCKLLLGTAISPWHQRVISSYSSFLYPLRLPRRQPMPLEPSSFGKRMLSPGVGTKSASMIRWSPVLRASLTVDP